MPEFAYQKKESEIKGGFYAKDSVRRNESLVLVLQTGLAGIHYHLDPERSPEDKEFLENLKPGTELVLYREPENEHDKWAIEVYTQDNRHIGYITRFKNETIARLMDLGREFKAVVCEKPPEPQDDDEYRRTVAPTEDYRISLEIYMVER